MPRKKKSTKVADQSAVADLNDVANRSFSQDGDLVCVERVELDSAVGSSEQKVANELEEFYDSLFEKWDERDSIPEDFVVDVPIDSLESAIGYSSLYRQMHQAFVRNVAFYRSAA